MNNTVTLTVKSMTYALKGKRILMRAGIRAGIVRTDERKSKNGCSHGIEISRCNYYSAIDILKRSNIEYSVYDSNL